mmetsp:Transcript_61079/g.186410  ORF Transcript_61079/g.186410 Transcript_61079/m.186410 type:complete len:204 (-) Transcript_61079:77-688(-)
MVHCDHGLDLVLDQLVDHIVVKLHALLVNAVGLDPGGNDARPRDRETIALDTHGRHHGDVLLVLVVEVIGDVARRSLDTHNRGHRTRLAFAHRAGHAHRVGARKGVPNGRAAAILLVRTFDLIRRGPQAPLEILREVPRRDGGVLVRVLAPVRQRELVLARTFEEARAARGAACRPRAARLVRHAPARVGAGGAAGAELAVLG